MSFALTWQTCWKLNYLMAQRRSEYFVFVRFFCCSVLFCSVVYFRLLHSSLVAVVVVTVVLLCKIRYLNEMLIPLQNNNNIGYVHCTKVLTLSLLILIASNLLSLCSSPTMCWLLFFCFPYILLYRSSVLFYSNVLCSLSSLLKPILHSFFPPTLSPMPPLYFSHVAFPNKHMVMSYCYTVASGLMPSLFFHWHIRSSSPVRLLRLNSMVFRNQFFLSRKRCVSVRR